MVDPMVEHRYNEQQQQQDSMGPNRIIVPFIACGSLSGFDPDRTYPLQLPDGPEYVPRAPTQEPINPPFQPAQQLQRTRQIDAVHTVSMSSLSLSTPAPAFTNSHS